MTLSELNQRISDLRAKRDGLHEELHALLANETISAGEARTREADIRAQIRAIHAEVGPMEMERAEIGRMVDGKPRKQAESWLSEPVTLS